MIRIFLALALSLFASTAGAVTCAPRDHVIGRLAEKYGETRQGVGLTSSGAMLEVFANDVTGSWTIALSKATGIMCLIASGQSFEWVADDTAPGDPL